MLNSHPGMLCYGELFNMTDPSKISWSQEGMATEAVDTELRRDDPCRFLEDRVFSGQPEGVAAVGFKLFYYHARKEGWDRVWSCLRSMRELLVVHIRRRNQLRRLVSEKLANKTNKWSISSESESHSEVTIRLDLRECIVAFKRVENWDREATNFFSSHRVHEVNYEGLLSNYEEESDRIQCFFGIPRADLVPGTKRQVVQPLDEIIENYDEICRGLAGTAWAEYLREA